MLETLSSGIGRTFGFSIAPAIAAVYTPIVESAKAKNEDDSGDEDDDDRSDTVPTR